MEYVLYIDKLWSLVFAIHYFILFLTGIHMKRKIRLWRILLVSVCSAAIFLVILLFPGIPVWIKIVLQLGVVDFLCCQAAFSFRTREGLVRAYLVSCGYGMLLGGLLLAWQRVGRIQIFSVKDIIGICAFMTACIWLACLYWNIRGRKEGNRHPMELDFYGIQRKCIGLYDSGNSLYEPYQHKPVIIIEESAFSDLLSRVPEQKKILIPYHSIGKKQGILEAVELPEMFVYERGEKQGYKRVIAAISRENVSKNGSYQVILHPDYCVGGGSNNDI